MRNGRAPTETPTASRIVRCAIYTRKSTEEGLAQEFNSLDAQREAAEAYIASQRHEGWILIPDGYDDGGFTGANMDRPALQRLLADIAADRVDCVVVYKVDRLSRSLLDFARIMETFDKHDVSFVSVTQAFNTTASLGRLTLNILLSFAQFEREMIAERTRDKMSAARRKGKWVGGIPVLGYDVDARGGRLVINLDEAKQVRAIFNLYLEHRSLIPVVRQLNQRGWTTKQWTTQDGREQDVRLLHRGKLPNWILKQVEVTLHLWARRPDLFSKSLSWGFVGGYSMDGVKPSHDFFLIELPQFAWYWEQGTEDIESAKQRIMETVGEIVDKRLGEMKQVIENLPRVPNKRRREHFTWTVLHQVRGDTFKELAAKWHVSTATVKNEVTRLKSSLGISLPKGRRRKNSIT